MEAGESEYSGLLKTRNLLIFRDAKNAEHGKIAPNWNVSGTRDFHFSYQFCEVLLEQKNLKPGEWILTTKPAMKDARPFPLGNRVIRPSGRDNLA
jgi:hypothetical protein